MDLRSLFQSKLISRFWAIILSLFLVFFYYFWDISNTTYDLHFKNYYPGFYNLLTDAIIAGQVHLLQKPPPELATLADPYDPEQNKPYRTFHDVSYYKGKFYIYWGIVPALTFFVPYKLVTGHHMPHGLAVFVFGFFASVFAALLLQYLRNKYFQQIPNWILFISILVIGSSNVVPHMLRRADVYETAISSALFFFTGAVYFLCTAFEKSTLNVKKLLLGSLFIGLAIGSRASFLLSLPLILFLSLVILRRNNLNQAEKYKNIRAILIPCLIILMLLGVYNYVRFENPFNFGHKYQFMSMHPKTIKYFDARCLPMNIYLYLFHWPEITPRFPFVFVQNTSKFFPVPVPPPIDFPPIHYGSQSIGMFVAIPFLLAIFLSPIFYWIYKNFYCKTICKKNKVMLLTVSFFTGSLILLLFIMLVDGLFGSNGIIHGLVDYIIDFYKITPAIIFIIFLLWLNILYWFIKIPRFCNSECQLSRSFPKLEFCIIVIPGLVNMLFSIGHVGTGYQYACDFLTLLMLIAFIIWFYFDSIILSRVIKLISRTLITTLCFISIIFGMAIGCVGFNDGLKEFAPGEFDKLQSLFKPVSEIISKASPVESKLSIYVTSIYDLLPKFTEVLLRGDKFKSRFLEINHKESKSIRGELLVTDEGKTIFWYNGEYWLPIRDEDKKYKSINSYGPVVMLVRFGNQTPSHTRREPLLTTGITGGGDIVYVEYPRGNKVIFGLDHWGVGGAQSKPIEIDPDKFYEVEMTLGSLYPETSLNKDLFNTFKVKLNGRTVIETESFSIYKTTEEQILIGENKIGGTYSIPKFTGEIKNIARVGIVSFK